MIEGTSRTSETSVTVLGLGHIGRRIAESLAARGYRVRGWARRVHEIDHVECFAGPDHLVPAISDSDFVISILPSTPQTRGLLDARSLAEFKAGSVLINVGRGDAVVEEDLITALDAGSPGAAVLDVSMDEPLPADSPLWAHPEVIVTPHVSGWHVDGAYGDIAENYKRLTSGQPLIHQVDRAAGY